MILDLINEVHSIWAIWTSRLQECKGRPCLGQARLWGRDSGFFNATLARRPNECNARQGYLERPDTW